MQAAVAAAGPGPRGWEAGTPPSVGAPGEWGGRAGEGSRLQGAAVQGVTDPATPKRSCTQCEGRKPSPQTNGDLPRSRNHLPRLPQPPQEWAVRLE